MHTYFITRADYLYTYLYTYLITYLYTRPSWSAERRGSAVGSWQSFNPWAMVLDEDGEVFSSVVRRGRAGYGEE
ncbi:MAG: hypothetical protein LBG11_12200 [Bifidobacteriaceae bacterium]|nr:hypothetical protein [Bifidobacteriaceae bacterium]